MKKLLCKLGKHSFSITKNSLHVKEYECACCKTKFTEDGYGRIVRLNRYWQKNNQLFEHYFNSEKAI